jgi:hypothetical protein
MMERPMNVQALATVTATARPTPVETILRAAARIATMDKTAIRATVVWTTVRRTATAAAMAMCVAEKLATTATHPIVTAVPTIVPA